MKRFLMISSAIGLCLAAPAFAQTPTDQEQLNRQRATQPGSSAPAAQAPASQSSPPANTERRQPSGQMQSQQQPAGSGSSSGSAQAPANQSQSGQAQQQPPASGSSTSAQAPANQQRSTTDRNQSGQAQSQQPAASGSSSSTAQAPANQPRSATTNQRNGAQTSTSQKSTTSQKATASRSTTNVNVSINETQRTRIASVLRSGNVRPANVNFRIAVGVAVPRTVTLHPLPLDIVEIVPQYRGYQYFVTTDEKIVIIEPRKKVVIDVIPAGGAARAQASGKVTFTDQQREVIRKRSSTLRSTATTGSAPSRIVVEEEVPAAIELEEFPAEIVTEVPVVRDYRYFRRDNEVIVVEPTRRRVIEVIR